jgi:hypothetical protein
MKHKLATTLLLVAALVMSTLASFSVAGPAMAAPPDDPDTPLPNWQIDGDCPKDLGKKPPCPSDNVVLKWNDELLQAIRQNAAATGPTVTARALGVLHTAMYDAWAAYDPTAKGTREDGPRQQAVNSEADKSKAISYAAYRVLVDLFPGMAAKGDFDAQMAELQYTPIVLGDYDPANPSVVVKTPEGVGNKAGFAVVNARKKDGSNPTLNPGAKADDPTDDTIAYPNPACTPVVTSDCYTPKNKWNEVKDPENLWRWQPLCVPTLAGVNAGVPPTPADGNCGDLAPTSNYAIQRPLTPQWGKITPFALSSPLLFDVPGPPKNADGSYSTKDIQTAVDDTADLTDAEKVMAEYWADGPGSEFPPGHMAVFAQALSRKRSHSVDTDVKLFFALGNALLDSSIASWAHKYNYDYWRPITAIRYHPAFKNKTVRSWRGPYNGYESVPGSEWRPYQAPHVVTPGFPEYVSGHSTFSGAGGYVLATFRGTDLFGATVTIMPGTSLFEPKNDAHPVGTPVNKVVLSWPTFTAASNEAGMSRRYGGIHFKSGDEHGRYLGQMVGRHAYSKAQSYIKGYAGY